ncbi:uncharacterized protein J4E84_008418 [Alternaria hordeiaustralica]|uniref:uncharacterized protein n=1 Tax=Alternaria hordeiaustralica TaxID=1187925 RepID=UPI0020C30D90|nr:uncharacterized protein J4E84_008418 [Alternaria hordeiaustralica]KAI4679387.1 hypothetical protein J4E84_008418 [Alternaria hordeiaustralica]
MGNLFTDKMSSSEQRDIQRRLERGSMPPRIPKGFPGVNPEGYLHHGTPRSSQSRSSVPASPRSQKPRNVDRIFDGSDHISDTGRKFRRRPSIEARTRKSDYHTLLEGGSLWSDDEVIDDVDADVQGPVESELVKEESSNRAQVQLALPIPNAAVDAPRQSMISVLYGRQNPDSWYLTRRLARLSAVNVDTEFDSTTLLRRRNIDADAAELHQLWRRTGVIPTRYRDVNFDPDGINPQHTWIACWPLINAAIHGYMIDDVEFVDRVMDLLEEKIVKGVRPDIDTISHIFGGKRHNMPKALGRFLVDRWLDSAAEGFGDVDPSDLPQPFLCSALETAMQRLSSDKRSPPLLNCQYHTHATSEECYKQRIAPEEAKRQQRYKYRREKASREAEQVAADSIECGIMAVDWEGRRLEQHRRQRDESDASLPAFDDRIERSREVQEAEHSDGLDVLGDVDARNRLNVKSSSSSSSMFGTAQADGPVDEVKFAPPPHEPPPMPPSPNARIERDDSTVEGDHTYGALLRNQQIQFSLFDGAMQAVKIEGDSESIALGAPAMPRDSDAHARTVSGESPRRIERRTCPGSIPESRSGILDKADAA